MRVPSFPGVTIDGPETRDMDDSVWVDKRSNVWVVTVCVANVAAHVHEGCDIDLKAREQTVTHYRKDGNRPMLPRRLSDDELSLWPDRARDVMAVEITLDSDLATHSVVITEGRMHSSAKLTYDDVPKILRDPQHKFYRVMRNAADLSVLLLDYRKVHGAVAEADLIHGWFTSEDGYVREFANEDEAIGHLLVQELMILANRSVAEYAMIRDIPILYRNHSTKIAQAERMRSLQQTDEAVHHSFMSVGLDPSHALDRAEYDVVPHGHYGLNLRVYAHFTSPIRRYADLACHHQIRAFLRDESSPHGIPQLKAIGKHINSVADRDRKDMGEAMKKQMEAMVSERMRQRELESLTPREFERAVKMQARGAWDPSPVFLDEFRRRMDNRTLTLLAMSTIVAEAPRTPGWEGVRGMILNSTAESPDQAVSILTQCPQIRPGFPDTTLQCEEVSTGTFHAILTWHQAESEGGVIQASFKDGNKKRTIQWATVCLLAKVLGLPTPSVHQVDVPTRESLNASDYHHEKNPIARLQGIAQGQKLPLPVYTFTTEQVANKARTILTCVCEFHGMTVTHTSLNKALAKSGAARDMLMRLG